MSSSIKTEPEPDLPDADQSLPPELDENTPVVWPTDPEMDSQNGEELSSEGKPSTSDDQRYSFWFGSQVDADEENVEDEQDEDEDYANELKVEEDVKVSKKSRKRNKDLDDPDWTEENDGIIMQGRKRNKHAYQNDTPKQFSRFRFQWTEEFQWLQYNAAAKVMFCKLCRLAGKTGKFATCGENEFDKGILYEHDLSKEHIEADCEVKRSQNDTSTDASLLAPQSDDFLDEELGADSQNTMYSESALLVALRTAYYAAQNQGDKTPSHVYHSMMALQDSCSVIGAKELRLKKQPEKTLILKQCDQSMSQEYEFGDSESLAEMHDVLARIVQEDMYTKISQSNYVTIIIQEKPDIDLQALQKQLVIHARYTHTHQGSLCVGFLGTVIVVQDKPDDAVKEIMQVLQDCDIPMQQVVAIQILCQKKNGKSVVSSSLYHWQLAERFAKDSDVIVLITAHTHPSWNTCVSLAAQKLEEGTKFQHMLGRLVIYLQSIPNKVEASDTLKDLVSDPLCQWDGLQMPPWLMVYKAAKVISTTWVTLIEILETEVSSENDSLQAQQFLDELQKYQFLVFIHLLLDLVPIVRDVERHLNEKTPDEACQDAIDALKNLQDNHGEHEKQFSKNVDLEKKMFCNHRIYFSDKQEEGASQMRVDFIGRVGEQITSRCDVLRKTDDVRRLFQIFNPRVLVSMGSKEMGEFGRDELKELAMRFLEFSADKDFFPEYQEMKMALYQHLKTDSLKTISEKMNTMSKSVQRMNPTSIAAQRCPNISRLLRCAVTIPGVCHHADREVLQVLKKAQYFMEKHGTEANTLSRMMIANHGVKLKEFDFTNALQEWNTL